MAAVSIKFTGGKASLAFIKDVSKKLGNGATLSVGFFENARYSDTHGIRGTKRQPLPVAQVAFWNEFGTSRSPPRAFFRTAVAKHSPEWGKDLGKIAVATHYDEKKTLNLMGERIAAQVVQSIVKWSAPPNSPRTVAIKGFNKPLIDEGIMQRSVGYEVKKGKPA